MTKPGVVARLPTIPPGRPESRSVADAVEVGAVTSVDVVVGPIGGRITSGEGPIGGRITSVEGPTGGRITSVEGPIGGRITSGGPLTPHTPPPPIILARPDSPGSVIDGGLRPASNPRGSAPGMPRGPPGLPPSIPGDSPVKPPRSPVMDPPSPGTPRPPPRRPMRPPVPLDMPRISLSMPIRPAPPPVISWFCMFLVIVSPSTPARPVAIIRCCISAISCGLSCIC